MLYFSNCSLPSVQRKLFVWCCLSFHAPLNPAQLASSAITPEHSSLVQVTNDLPTTFILTLFDSSEGLDKNEPSFLNILSSLGSREPHSGFPAASQMGLPP